jgi:peroxiredoxin Q/BCP
MLNEGDAAVMFKLPQAGGGEFDLAAQAGKTVVLYFYPKDDTGGCTKQAQGFSESADEFAKAGALVVGVSPDSVKSHDKFVAKHGLNLILVSDEERRAIEAYGVWAEKKMYGKSYMGVERSTFLIGPDGKIVKAWRGVKVPGHVDEVLKAAKAMKA